MWRERIPEHSSLSRMNALGAVVCVFVVAGFNEDVAAGRLPSASSPLGKYVVALAQPGTSNHTAMMIGDGGGDDGVTSCPMGRAGLACRRAEARRGVESCPNGACNACDMCAGASSPVLWPNCCRQNGVCCSQLAKSCQSCDQPDLYNFCKKHFKRCF